MDARTISIDWPAFGYLPLRLCRRVSASALFSLARNGALSACAIVGFAVYTAEDAPPIAFVAILGVLASLYFWFFQYWPHWLGLLIERVPRRLWLAVLTTLVAVIVVAAVTRAHAADLVAKDAMPIALTAFWATVLIAYLIAFLFIAVIVWYALIVLPVWQASVSETGWLAVRGPRARFERMPEIRSRHFLLPAYIGAFVQRSDRISLAMFFGLSAIFRVSWLDWLVIALLSLAGLAALYGPTPSRRLGVVSTESNAALPYVYPTISAETGAAIGLLILTVLLVIWLSTLLSRFFWRRGERLTARLYQSVRAIDDRAPLLFLRGFNDDKALIRSGARNPFLNLFHNVADRRTLDSILIENVSAYGPVVAIGDPASPRAPLGASRIFVRSEDADWKDVVSDLTAASKAIVLCLNDTEGLQWELTQVAKTGLSARVILIASPSKSADENWALFTTALKFFGANAMKPLRTCWPIAAFMNNDGHWIVLTAKHCTVATLSVGLNRGVQTLFGADTQSLYRPA